MSKIALYIRLSVEDQIKNKESESIISQRMYLNDYLDQYAEFKHLERVEYVDATVIIGLKQNPTYGRRFSPIFLLY